MVKDGISEKIQIWILERFFHQYWHYFVTWQILKSTFTKVKSPQTQCLWGFYKRRQPDSNWWSGCCRPTPYRLAMSPYSIIFCTLTLMVKKLQTSALSLSYLALFNYILQSNFYDKEVADFWLIYIYFKISNDSKGIWTPVTAVKGRCLNRLTMEPFLRT